MLPFPHIFAFFTHFLFPTTIYHHQHHQHSTIMSSDNKNTFPCLNNTNWGQWADNMEAYLSTKELWEYVDGSCVQPRLVDPTKPTLEEKKELSDWRRKSARASGEIWLGLEDSQKVHVKDLKGDPVAMWKKLESVHLPKTSWSPFQCL